MLRALLFAVKIGLLVAAAVWVANRPGVIEIDWMGYHITTHIGIALLALLVLLLFMLALHRLVLGLAGLPKAWRRKGRERRQEKGYRALTQGLTAVAAGDAAHAGEKAAKARQCWPEDKGLTLLLEAQAARLRGDEDTARARFDQLLAGRDTAFLGLRGLLTGALERGDTARGLELARKAQAMHPRQPWVVRMVYDLEIQQKQWDKAESTLKRALKLGAIPEKQGKGDHIAMLAAQSEEMALQGDKAQAIRLLRRAHRLDPAFTPIAERLAALYLERGNRRSAKNVIETTWKRTPHPDLIPLWARLAPASGDLRWYEKLVALKPDSAEGQIAVAQAAMDEELWGQARQYLERAAQIGQSAKLCRLYAQLEEKLGHTEEAKNWLAKAADAPPEKVWTCRETGQIYERWSPVVKPHGAFNAMVWDYPRPRHALSAQTMLPQNELLITAR